jgi:hypothetical protein
VCVAVFPQWIARRDIAAGEQLTIDYCLFDANCFICIARCLCGSPACREFVRGDDYRIAELQQRYAGHFLPYIQKKMAEDRDTLARTGSLVVGVGAEGAAANQHATLSDWSAAGAHAFHTAANIDIEAHNKRALEALIARFDSSDAAAATGATELPPCSVSSSPALSASDAADVASLASTSASSSSGSEDEEDEEEEEERVCSVNKRTASAAVKTFPVATAAAAALAATIVPLTITSHADADARVPV